MKILNLIESIILEAAPDEIYNSYYKDIPRDEFNQIVMADPVSISNESGLKRIGKYAKLLIGLYRKKGLKLEDLPRAKEYLDYIYKHNISIDSNKVKSLTDLYDLVKGYYAKDTKDLGSILSSLNEKEYKKVFQNEKWSIFVPLTEKASCYLGVNTEWCTTWGPESLNPKHKDRGNLFSRYHNQGSLYIIISNSDVNEKYQFHFESKQYMDRDDKLIGVSEFLENNTDIKNFFFPSLISNNVSEDDVKLQIGRLSALDDDDVRLIVGKLLSLSSKDNPLISALISQDEDLLNSLLTDEEIENYELNKNDIEITLENSLSGQLEQTQNTLSYYQSEANSGYDVLWDRMGNEDTEYINDTLKYFFEAYYQDQSSQLKSLFGYTTYEQFKSDHLDDFTNNSSMWDTYSEAYVRKNTDAFESRAGEEVDAIEKYISFGNIYRGDTNVVVSTSYFLLFLAKSGIKKIDGNEYKIIDVLEEYIKHYKIDYDYEGIWDFNDVGVNYDDLKKDIEEYFDKRFENFEGVKRCTELRLTLNNVVKNIFKGSTFLENDEFILILPSLKIDCDKESIDIIFNNKKTGESFRGPIKVENLASYASNYKLFESILSIKNLL